MSITPQKMYNDRKDGSIRPSWNENKGYVNEEHRHIFEQTKDIPGWQMEGDSYKLYEMGYFAGDVILEIGTFGGRSAVIELKGALSNRARRDGPLFFGTTIEMESVRRTYNTLTLHRGLMEHSLLYHGNLEAFFSCIMFGKYSSEAQFEIIRNNKKIKIPITWEILQSIQSNRVMLITLMRKSGMNKDEILESMKNPENDVKEILFEVNFGEKTEKKYCPECNGRLIGRKYSCPECGKDLPRVRRPKHTRMAFWGGQRPAG